MLFTRQQEGGIMASQRRRRRAVHLAPVRGVSSDTASDDERMDRALVSLVRILARQAARQAFMREREHLRGECTAMKAALYARFSSDIQRDTSIADQLRLCRLFAERQGWTLAQ